MCVYAYVVHCMQRNTEEMREAAKQVVKFLADDPFDIADEATKFVTAMLCAFCDVMGPW